MKTILFSVLLLTASFVFIEAKNIKCPPGGVGQFSDADFWKGIDGAQYITDLNDDTHDQFVQDNSNAFIMYYATWCGYSKQARSGFGGAAKKMNGKVSFGAVDCDQAPNACQKVQGYPTFFYYSGGQYSDEYDGQRTTQDFVNYLNTKSG